MAGQEREMEGDNKQRRAAAREARERGEQPSAVGATQGASKQRKKAPNDASHQEKMDLKHEGKQGPQGNVKDGEEPRPGNRESDPKRTDRYE